jgi:hypothetical protein
MIGAVRAANATGATRACPHCRATILESAVICPGCRHHLRFDKDMRPGASAPTHTAWQIEGQLNATSGSATTEYSILISVRNERNEEVARQVVNVGALQGSERRTFTLSVETAESTGPMAPRRR